MQTHLTAIVFLWEFQKRTAPNPWRTARESAVDGTTDPETKATGRLRSEALLLKSSTFSRAYSSVDRKAHLFFHHPSNTITGKGSGADQRKLILINLMPSEQAKALAA